MDLEYFDRSFLLEQFREFYGSVLAGKQEVETRALKRSQGRSAGGTQALPTIARTDELSVPEISEDMIEGASELEPEIVLSERLRGELAAVIQRQAQAVRQPGIEVAGRFQHPPGQTGRRFQIDRIIERNQRLQGRIRADTADLADFATARIKRGEGRVRCGAFEIGIQAAPIAVFAFFFAPRLRAVTHRRQVQKAGRRRIDAAPTQFQIQQTTRRQRNVAHDFAIHTETRPARQQTVVRIFLRQRRRDV